MTIADPIFTHWLATLEERHLANLRFSEVTRALRALSSAYVERRATLADRSAFESAGKRAAYALYYGPLHFLTLRAILKSRPELTRDISHIADWGCGTGAAGAAWATTVLPAPRVSAIDIHPWTIGEAATTYQTFSIDAVVRRGDIARSPVPSSADAALMAWVINEVHDETRAALLPKCLNLAAQGVRVLIVEPIATRVTPWWAEWTSAFEAAGGQADEWRVRVDLPDLLRRLDRASGMRHDELTARSLTLPPERGRGRRR